MKILLRVVLSNIKNYETSNFYNLCYNIYIFDEYISAGKTRNDYDRDL